MICEGVAELNWGYVSWRYHDIILSRIKQGVPCGSHQPAEPTVLEALTDNSLGVTQILEDWRYKYGQYEKICILYA